MSTRTFVVCDICGSETNREPWPDGWAVVGVYSKGTGQLHLEVCTACVNKTTLGAFCECPEARKQMSNARR